MDLILGGAYALAILACLFAIFVSLRLLFGGLTK
jgi:hypothetical protein